MARKRMIDPDFWDDEKLAKCTRDERLFFMGLISNADDEGRGRANPRLLKSLIFPYDEDLTSDIIEIFMENLGGKKVKLIKIYSHEDQFFYFIPTFKKHQTINKPQKSKLPEPGVFIEFVNTTAPLPYHYGNTTAPLPPNIKEVKRKEVKKKLKENNIGQEVNATGMVSENEEQNPKPEIQKPEIVYFLNPKLNETFLNFIQMRKKIKKPLEDHALKLAMDKLEKLSDGNEQIKIEILEESILNSWQGLFPLSNKQNKKSGIQKAFEICNQKADEEHVIEIRGETFYE